jgi:uncharacterized lipoprotein YajG
VIKLVPLLALALMAACTNPSLNADIGISESGVRVYPSVSGTLGAATVSVSP